MKISILLLTVFLYLFAVCDTYCLCSLLGIEQLSVPDTLVGWVVNPKEKGIKNVSITIHSKEGVVRTDKKGIFVFENVSLFDTLMLVVPKNKIYYVPISGMQFLKITINNDQHFTTNEAKQAILNAGYGQKERKLNTSNDIVISGDELRQTGRSNIVQALTGKVPGLQIEYVEGLRHIFLRGKNSITGNNYALYVIDGSIVESLDHLNLYNVKEVSVMRSASAYGSRGTNGAIIVTTQ
jgi:hypothetical protein